MAAPQTHVYGMAPQTHVYGLAHQAISPISGLLILLLAVTLAVTLLAIRHRAHG
jgi:hypothetical protein